MLLVSSNNQSEFHDGKKRSACFLVLVMISGTASMQFAVSDVSATTTDQDADGLPYGIEFLINTQPQDWDSDNDGLPDGWEWQYGLDPLSASGDNGSTGDPDSDGLTNLNEYLYGIPSGWDEPSTANILDNGVWWNGTIPVSNWDEESAMQVIQGSGSDGVDEDPVGNICIDTFDNDHDGMVDSNDDDFDGDADCSSDDDDGDGIADEDPNGWDTDGDGMPDGWEAANGLDPTSNSNQDGTYGDPDSDGLSNIYEYVNPAWGTRNGSTFPPTQYFRPGPINMTATESPCNPVLSLGPGGCSIFTAEVDGITRTDPQNNDTDGDGLNDSMEALVLLTDPTSPDTDSDGILDGVEFNGSYGDPAQGSDPRNNNTDGDFLEDGDEDINGNGVIDEGETDPTRVDDDGDFDEDGIQNWEENNSCTLWDVADSDGGGVGDGDEGFPGQTDPCTSIFDLIFTVTSWDAIASTLTLNSTLGINPDPFDWRGNAPHGYYISPNGTLTPFRYDSIEVDSLFMKGVDVEPPAGALTILFRNGSWCWDASVNATNDPWCDDDYKDSDGDGLADWEELTATWGYLSDPSEYDTDGDGVDDLSEILNSTDPREPCDNLLDSDGDGLNNYFENTTGCSMIFGIGGNLTSDVWFTLWNVADSDNGGVEDGQEYLDGTNPQDNPDDDINPLDTDGDGIPDLIEQDLGMDWLDPDSDGGGVPDGEECPEQFWILECIGSPSDPFNPLDDIQNSALYFTASNTSVGLDPTIRHYWRWHTYDYYTGVSWGVNSTLLGNTLVTPDFSTMQGVADQSFWNHSEPLSWEIIFGEAGNIGPGQELIQPHNLVNLTTWVDQFAGLNFSNYTRDIIVDSSVIQSLYVSAPEVILTTAVRENTTVFANSEYGKDLPQDFINSSSIAFNVTRDVIDSSGAISAWDKVTAIQNFIVNGNETFSFLRNHYGSGRANGLGLDSDITHWILNSSREGNCDEFTSLFVTMLRIAGIPARKVTGFSGGEWDGKSFNVYGKDFTRWAEVHLQTNQNLGELDLGWIPFEACPDMSEVTVNVESWGPTHLDRNTSLSEEIWVAGILEFVENQTAAENVSISMYLVEPSLSQDLPGSAAIPEHMVANVTTDANGSFNLTGLPSQVIQPGFGSLVILTSKKGYVGVQGISVPGQINVTDNVSFSISSPLPIDSPMLGIGVNTSFSGQLSWASSPYLDPSIVDDLQVFLNYTSQVDGDVSIVSSISGGGYYEFIVPIDESEPLGLMSAELSFQGWHFEDLNNNTPPSYHALPGSKTFEFNITLSPNLSVVMESEGENNSILEIGRDVYLNGTVISRGPSPVPLNGTLILQMRRADISGPFVTLSSWYLDNSSSGQSPENFSIIWPFSASDVPLPAGPVDVRILFDSDDLNANDEEQFVETFGIRSFVVFNYELTPAIRGREYSIDVLLADHTGSSFASFSGNYTLLFDEENVWNLTDPDAGRITPTFTPGFAMQPGDYFWNLSYLGSTWLSPNSTSGMVRVRGIANASAVLSDEWSIRGSTNWISGFATDMVLLNQVTGNNSSVTVQLLIPSDLPPTPGGFPASPTVYNIANGYVDELTGAYNLSFEIPSGIPSGVYDIDVTLGFSSNPPEGGSYYNPGDPTTIQIGIHTEFVVITEPENIILTAGDQLSIQSFVTDVEDPGRSLSGVALDVYFDWGGSLEIILQSGTTDDLGQFSFNPIVPSSTPPGFYDVRIHAPDDISDSLDSDNAGRWFENQSFVNLTVQVASNVEISTIQSQVTALQFFNIAGSVMDSVDSNRTVDGPVGINVFFLDEPDELLIQNLTTDSSGGFNISVPTDTSGDGVTRGDRTVVVSVVNGSTPFYLTGNGDAQILVIGVSQFIDTSPFINTIVDRGDSATMAARLVEFSDNEQPLSGFEVLLRFHETWLEPGISESDGSVLFEFEIPHDHPLGLINVTFVFNGSGDLNQAVEILNTIIVRSPTTMVIDPISANPLPGEYFNVTGSLTSSNGTGLSDTSGNPLNPTLTFSIDSDSNSFTVSQILFQSDGTWRAELRLDLSFPRGPHGLEVSFSPQVTYFSAASGFSVFDSRGFSVLTIENPNDLDPDNRTVRGETFDIEISLIDNSGSTIPSATILVSIDNLTVWGGLTDLNGSVSASILVRPERNPGPMVVTATFTGINGTIGLVGDEAWTRVVVLARTELVLKQSSEPSIAGSSVTFEGSLLDERGQILLDDGNLTSGLIHLFIDGVDVGPAYTKLSNRSTGQWSITYQIPTDMDYGSHTARVEFLGGFSWVDPMGQGDSLNPEYYLPSFDSIEFNVSQPSQVIISTPPSEIDRSGLAVVEGFLTDGVGREIPNRDLSLSIDGQELSVVSVDQNGSFTGFVAIAPDMPLGPILIEVEFSGEDYILPSNSSVVFTVFSNVFVTLNQPDPVAIGDSMVFSGSVKDNLEDGWLGSHTIEVFVDGILVGVTSSLDGGNWSLGWIIPESMVVGNHTISVVSPSQGFYRQGGAGSNFTVSYHTTITLQAEETYASRGEKWNFTGRLYESDTGFEQGLVGREISVLMDGLPIASIITEEGGIFSFSQRIKYSTSRGSHNISFEFGGEFLYLPSDSISEVFALSDVAVEVQPITNTIVRGDTSPSNSIMIQGLIREVGGESTIFDNLTMIIRWGDTELPISSGPWDNPNTMNFQIRAKAQEFMHPGENTITIVVKPDQSRFLNGVSKELEIMVMVEVDFVLSDLEISNGQRVIRGTVNATARDTGAPLEGLSLTASLANGSVTHFSVSKLTDIDGVFEYEFKSMAPLPPLSERSLPPNGWGSLSVMIGSDSDFILPGSLSLLPSSGVIIDYEETQTSSIFDSAAIVFVGILVATLVIAVGAMLLNTRRKSTIRELAKVLGQTVEMLASGDEYRRAIFLCYENLCSVLMKRGFLRRNFETVREFESAIRDALPISEPSLVSLDRIFEEARYSSHVLGDSHRDNAQLALSSVIQEVGEIQDIPKREPLTIEIEE